MDLRKDRVRATVSGLLERASVGDDGVLWVERSD